MGRGRRTIPQKLGQKLLMIRQHLNLTQQQMIEKIHPGLDSTARAIISQYERGERIPSLIELIEYANLADTTVDCLVRDEVDLEFNSLSSSEKD